MNTKKSILELFVLSAVATQETVRLEDIFFVALFMAFAWLPLLAFLLKFISETKSIPKIKRNKKTISLLFTILLAVILGSSIIIVLPLRPLFREQLKWMITSWLFSMTFVYVLGVWTFEEYSKEWVVNNSVGEKGERYWQFRINPDRFRIFDWWRDHPDLETETWSQGHFSKIRSYIVLYFAKHMNKGDRVVFWVEGKNGGVCALGEVISHKLDTVEPEKKEYGKIPAKEDLVVKVKFLKKLIDKPISREFCAKQPLLKRLVKGTFLTRSTTKYSVRLYPMSPISPKIWGKIEDVANKQPT